MLEKVKRDGWFVIAIVLILFLLWAFVKTNTDAAYDRVRFREQLEQQDQEIQKLKDKEKTKTPEATPPKKATAKPKPQVKPAVYVPIVSKYPETKHIPAMVKGIFGSDFSVIVAECESVEFRPDVVFGPKTGAAGERGVMQIHPTHLRSGALARAGFTWNDMFIPEKNLAFGKILLASVDGAWYPTWTCAKLV